MIIKNIGNKVIGVGGKVIMPGAQVSVKDADAKVPAMVAMEEMGFVVRIEEGELPQKPTPVVIEPPHDEIPVVHDQVESVDAPAADGKRKSSKAKAE